MDIFTPQQDQGSANVNSGRNDDTSPTSALAANTSIASIAIEDAHHIRVYFQDTEGYLGQSECRDGVWTAGTRINTAVQAKPNTPLAVVSTSLEGYGQHIRLYHVDMNNVLQEHCWPTLERYVYRTLGELSIKVDYRSKIAACAWVYNGNSYVRVYYQAPYEHGISHVSWSTISTRYPHAARTWYRSPDLDVSCPLAPALLGSGLAALYLPQNLRIAIFYQSASDRMVREYWTNMNGPAVNYGATVTLGEAAPGTAIAAITWSLKSSPPDRQFRVYYEHTNGMIVENGYGMNSVEAYSGPRHLTKSLMGTTLSACCFSSGTTTHTRVYLQQEHAKLLEYCGIGGWAEGATLPVSS